MKDRKATLIQRIEAINNDQAILFLQNELDFFDSDRDIIDDLSISDKKELISMVEEPFGYNTVSFEEYRKATDKWRKS